MGERRYRKGSKRVWEMIGRGVAYKLPTFNARFDANDISYLIYEPADSNTTHFVKARRDECPQGLFNARCLGREMEFGAAVVWYCWEVIE